MYLYAWLYVGFLVSGKLEKLDPKPGSPGNLPLWLEPAMGAGSSAS